MTYRAPQARRDVARWGRSALVLALLVAPWAAMLAQDLALAPGDPAPSIVGFDLDNNEVHVAWEGLTLVNFWATWCQPCQVEMPELQKLHESFSGRGFRVVGVQREEGATAEQTRDFLAHAGVRYPTYLNETAAGWGGVNILPTTFLVDAEGTILRKYVGGGGNLVEVLHRDVEDKLAGRSLQALPIPGPVTAAPPAPK